MKPIENQRMLDLLRVCRSELFIEHKLIDEREYSWLAQLPSVATHARLADYDALRAELAAEKLAHAATRAELRVAHAACGPEELKQLLAAAEKERDALKEVLRRWPTHQSCEGEYRRAPLSPVVCHDCRTGLDAIARAALADKEAL